MPTEHSRRESRRRRSRSRERDRDRYDEDRSSRRRERDRDRSRSVSRSPGRADRRYRDVERKRGRERDWDLRPARDDKDRDYERSDRDRRADSDQDTRQGDPDSARNHEGPQYDGGFVRGGVQVPDGGMYPDPAETFRGERSDRFETGHDRGWDRQDAYQSGLSDGLSDDFHNDARGSGNWQGPKFRQNPSPTLYLKGIPEDKQEGDIFNLLQAFPNVKQVRVLRDRGTGLSRGYAFVDFETVEDAMRLMESEARHRLEFDGYPISFEYSNNSLSTIANQSGPAPSVNHLSGMDWICGMCAAVNFARRLECYQCSSVRPRDPQRVTIEPDAPSNILKISALDPNTSEETLHYLFSAHAPLKDLRIVRDKFSGAPRGFGFVHFHTIADASRALNAVQGAMPEGQQEPLRLCFARDKATGVLAKAAMANDALEAAQAMQQYSSWEPKQFNEDALDPDKEAEGKEAAAGAGVSSTTSASAVATNSQAAANTPAGFVYDANTGYWYDSVSGYFYDANTGLYYHSSTNLWYAYDQATGEYKAVTNSDSATATATVQPQPQPQTQSQPQQPSTSPEEPAAPGTSQPSTHTNPLQTPISQNTTAPQQPLHTPHPAPHHQDVQPSVTGRDDASLLQAAQSALNTQHPHYTRLPLAQQLQMQQLMVQYIQAGQYMQQAASPEHIHQYQTQQQQLQQQMHQLAASVSSLPQEAPVSAPTSADPHHMPFTPQQAQSLQQAQPLQQQFYHPQQQYTSAPSHPHQPYQYSHAHTQPQISTAAQNAIAVAEATVAAVQQRQQVVPTVVSTSYKPPIKPSERRKGAVIGAAPKLNPERLAARAQMEREKELEKQQQERLQQQQQQQPQQQQEPPPMFSPPSGIHPDRLRNLQAASNAQPGLGAQPAAAQFSGPAPRPAGPAPRPSKTGGAVQGVIHRGKWSQRLYQG